MADFEKTIGWDGIKDSDLAKKLEKPWEENGELIYPPNKKREAMQRKYEMILQDKHYTIKESLLKENEINILPLIKKRTYMEKIFIPASNDEASIKFIVDTKNNNVFGANYKEGKYTIQEYFNTFDKNYKKYINIKAFLTNNPKHGGYDIAAELRTDAANDDVLDFYDEEKIIEADKYLII